MSPETLTSNHHHTVTQLRLEALVVELLENVLEMTREVHDYCFIFNPWRCW